MTMASQFKNDFDIIEFLGNGSFGKVYNATHKIDGKSYAIKEISVEVPYVKHYCKDQSQINEWKIKLEKEVKHLAKLQSKFVIQYYHCWYEPSTVDQDDDPTSGTSDLTSGQSIKTRQHFYIKMELCQSDLKKWLESHPQKNQRNLEEIYLIFSQIMQGLDYIHKFRSEKFQEMIHRDIKPANIMLQVDDKIQWCAKIGDFGLSTIIDEQNENDLSQRGTPIYMSPEMASCKGYNSKTDMFSSGLMLLESIYVFNTHAERSDAFFDIRNGNYKFPSELDVDIVKQLTVVDSKKRLSAQEAYKLFDEKFKLLTASTSSNIEPQESNVLHIGQPSSTEVTNSVNQNKVASIGNSSISSQPAQETNTMSQNQKKSKETVDAYDLADIIKEDPELLLKRGKLQKTFAIQNSDWFCFKTDDPYDFFVRLIQCWANGMGKATVGNLRTTLTNDGFNNAAGLLDEDEFPNTTEIKL